MPALDLMVKLFSESKEEIHRYITKIEVTADTTYKGVVDDIKTKNGKYFSLAQTSVLRRSEDKLSFANTKSKIVLTVLDDDSWRLVKEDVLKSSDDFKALCE